MKKIVPWIVVAVFAAWVLSTLREPPETGFHTRDFGRLPVLLNGRVQPLDSVARNTLLQIRERQSVGDLSATAWLMETMMKPEAADTLNVFRIDSFELLNMLQLPEAQKYYSFSQIQPHLDDLTREAQRANNVEDANRTAFQRQLLKLDNALEIYQRLKLSLCPPGTTDFAGQLAAYEQAVPAGVAAAQAQEAKKTYDQAALNRLLDFLSSYNDLSKYAYPLMVPPATDAKSRADWQNIGQNLMSVVHGNDLSPAVKDYAAMTTAYNQNQPAAFNQALDDYRHWLDQWFVLENRQGVQEFFFNDFEPFYKAMVIYVTAFLLAIGALLTFALTPKLSETLRRSAFWLVVLGGVIHTFGLVFRMWLEGRPPVTNLYSSAIFIGWGCVILGIILERVFAVGLGSAVASFAGFVTLVIAHNLSMDGDTMEMLRAVLDTNFWLATHVVVVTLGYASTFMAGLLGVTYVLLGLFTPLLKYKSGNLELGKVLAKMAYGIVCFAALFSFTGTVLGGIWADQSWGRFWGWDPKENGALLIVLWNAAILHARWGGLIRERGLMNMVIFGNIVTSWSWFGVNMLGIGLHSYGFMAAAFWWLLAFVLSQVALILLGLLPTGMWEKLPNTVGADRCLIQRPQENRKVGRLVRRKIGRDNDANFDIVRATIMNLKINLDSASGLEHLQNMKANIWKLMPLTLCLIALLAGGTTSCVNQPNVKSGGPVVGQTTPPTPAYAVQDLLPYAKPLCGTAADGDLYPGVSAPFGMIQWSPDTGSGRHCGGYAYENSSICGFSLDHLSGAGCTYGGNFAFMPVLSAPTNSPGNRRTAFRAPFSHDSETAKPGYYALTLGNGIKVELTATERSGFGRFTYPAGGTATMVINAASAVNGVKESAIQIHPGRHEITGWAVGGHFCGGPDQGTTYFCAIFNQPFAHYGTWNDTGLSAGSTNNEGIATGAFVSFKSWRGRTVLVKVGISYVSVANARANVEAESPLSAFSAKAFDRAAATAGQVWNLCLNKIQVSGGTKDELETFYSMLYRVFLGPTICSDANGEYMGYDGQVHQMPDHHVQYANFSGWDIYRSESQLLAMLDPQRASDMAQSLLLDYQQGGTFPRWGVPNEDSGVMMGDPAAPIIADFYAFGATNFDAHAALTGLVRAATDPSVFAPRTGTHERDALADYLKLGYVPEDQQGGYGNVSMTEEYGSADFALSQFAQALGDDADSAMLLGHAQNWTNHFNPESGYLEMRRRDGSWAPGFRPGAERYDGDQGYVEGTAAQYVWMVPYNLKTLFDLMGGPQKAGERLDQFFTGLNAGGNSVYAYLGNEPCLETPWEYCFLGQPYKTQNVVRQAMTQLFSAAPHGYPGNDDLGEMSSWYVFAALGMYPELPGSDVLVLDSPLFPKAVLHVSDGDVTILGQGAAANAPYVQSLTVNGQTWNKPWIRFPDIARGGALNCTLGTTPNPNWGSNPSDAPPSFTAAPDSRQ